MSKSWTATACDTLVYVWELDGPVERVFAGLSTEARGHLVALLDAAVFDPVNYGRRPGDADTPLRMLPFGSRQQGLVTFLVYPPERLVLVVAVLWP